MANEAIVLRDFSGGDEGRQRPARNDTTKFRATNAWVYPSGGIGPRPPFQYFPISGLPQQKLNTFNVTRPNVTAAYTSPPAPFHPQTYMFFGFADSSIYKSHATSGSASSAGTLDSQPVGSTVDGETVYYTVETGSGASITDNDALTEIPAMPNGHYITRWGARLVVAVALASGGAVAVSERDDPTTWNDNIRVGSASVILGLYVQRNTLVIPKFDGDIWVMRGTPTVNETLRQEDQSAPHGFAWRAPGAVAGQSNVWYCADRGMVKFTGAQAILGDRPDLPLISGYSLYPWSANLGTVIPLQEDDEFLLVGTADKTSSGNVKQVWVQAHRPQLDGWTRHTLPTNEFTVVAGANFTGAVYSSESSEAIRGAQLSAGVAAIVTGSDTSGNGGRAPRVYVINSRQEYPHVPVGTISPPSIGSYTLLDGDTSLPVVADFRTAEYWDPKGRQLRVTDVAVDYSYNPNITPLATYNKFDLTVEAMQDTNSAVVLASTSQTFTPSGSGSTPDGSPIIRGQQRFGVGDQGAGLGFRVRLADWRGIVVHGFTIYVQSEDGAR